MSFYVWEDAEGRLNITSMDAGADPSREFAIMEARGDRPPNAKTVTVDTLPDTSQQHRWRFRGDEIVIDPTRPDTRHPRQGLLDRVESAKTLEELRGIVTALIRGDTA